MSATVKDGTASSPADGKHETKKQEAIVPAKGGNWKGFVAGVFSGIAKLSVGYVKRAQ